MILKNITIYITTKNRLSAALRLQLINIRECRYVLLCLVGYSQSGKRKIYPRFSDNEHKMSEKFEKEKIFFTFYEKRLAFFVKV